ncbi:hypothetical protein EDB80DRAFT_708495 [Ilyonectria destructans]|nr:hypothetical protein EDB80DRAFT_708495 [Ilyonectria destructans]
MQNFFIPRSWGRLSRIGWSLFSWIAVGHFSAERKLLCLIQSKFRRFGAGRRCNIEARITKRGPSKSSKSSDSD